jgi:DNA-directed RNA polymerase subunit RPC12/RpoP
MRLVEIIRGWAIYWQALPENRKLMEERLIKCDSCPHKVVLNPLGQVLLENRPEGHYKCRLCSCPLEVKGSDPKQHCPRIPAAW